jgi:hypothetical protein
MLRSILTVSVLIATCLAGVTAAALAGSARPTVKTTLKGTCTLKTSLDANGAVTSSTLTCDANGRSGSTRLTYATMTVAPGNGAPGRETGTLTARGALSSVTLDLAGTRSVGTSNGHWTLGAAKGETPAALEKHGVYASQTTDLAAVAGTTSTTVKIVATFACWLCGPGA